MHLTNASRYGALWLVLWHTDGRIILCKCNIKTKISAHKSAWRDKIGTCSLRCFQWLHLNSNDMLWFSSRGHICFSFIITFCFEQRIRSGEIHKKILEQVRTADGPVSTCIPYFLRLFVMCAWKCMVVSGKDGFLPPKKSWLLWLECTFSRWRLNPEASELRNVNAVSEKPQHKLYFICCKFFSGAMQCCAKDWKSWVSSFGLSPSS